MTHYSRELLDEHLAKIDPLEGLLADVAERKGYTVAELQCPSSDPQVTRLQKYIAWRAFEWGYRKNEIAVRLRRRSGTISDWIKETSGVMSND